MDAPIVKRGSFVLTQTKVAQSFVGIVVLKINLWIIKKV